MSISIVVCFEDADRDRFLMARHAERGWELPGGRVRDGEDPVRAAVREFGEEIGRELLDPDLVVTQERDKGTFHVVSGTLGPKAPERADPEDVVEDWRFVETIDDVEPLAFPDDPYEATGEALGRSLTGPS